MTTPALRPWIESEVPNCFVVRRKTDKYCAIIKNGKWDRDLANSVQWDDLLTNYVVVDAKGLEHPCGASIDDSAVKHNPFGIFP